MSQKIRPVIFGAKILENKLALQCCKMRLFGIFSNTVVSIFRPSNKYYIEMHDESNERVISKKYTYTNALMQKM